MRLILTAAALAAVPLVSLAQDDPVKQAIDARHGFYQMLAINMGTLSGMAKGDVAYDEAAASRAAANIEALTQYDLPSLFIEAAAPPMPRTARPSPTSGPIPRISARSLPGWARRRPAPRMRSRVVPERSARWFRSWAAPARPVTTTIAKRADERPRPRGPAVGPAAARIPLVAGLFRDPGMVPRPVRPAKMTLHFWCGYVVAGLLLFRLVWGFFGPAPARFSHFLRGTGGDRGAICGGCSCASPAIGRATTRWGRCRSSPCWRCWRRR